MIKDIERNSPAGLGKPEKLKGNYQGYYSRRIDEKNRLVYKIANGLIEIAQCRTHYKEK